ncbi:hypothetical protein SAMN03159495_0724 [Pseudomonas sp. NFR16]|nr:hypothetical protein [Pseudomonas sp. NFR16]SEI53666.1 hypothetical protein SAMN03159495_0724 [Pseudomonas sp. NFR16]
MGGYVPAGAIPVLSGYLIDFFGLGVGITSLALIIASLAGAALLVLWRRSPHPVNGPEEACRAGIGR